MADKLFFKVQDLFRIFAPVVSAPQVLRRERRESADGPMPLPCEVFVRPRTGVHRRPTMGKIPPRPMGSHPPSSHSGTRPTGHPTTHDGLDRQLHPRESPLRRQPRQHHRGSHTQPRQHSQRGRLGLRRPLLSLLPNRLSPSGNFCSNRQGICMPSRPQRHPPAEPQ